MYPDPKRVRAHRITLRLDQYERDLLVAMANYQGEQFATLMRQLLVREAQQVLELSHGPTSVQQHAA